MCFRGRTGRGLRAVRTEAIAAGAAGRISTTPSAAHQIAKRVAALIRGDRRRASYTSAASRPACHKVFKTAVTIAMSVFIPASPL
jgi:hypothetical protein